MLYGITGGTNLVTIDSALPASATSVPITGLQPGEGIRGLDTRPRDGEIYALTDQQRLYRIDLTNPAAPQAVLAVTLSSAIGGMSLGMDWDPYRDALRIVTDTNDNLLVDLATGVVTVQTPISLPPRSRAWRSA